MQWDPAAGDGRQLQRKVVSLAVWIAFQSAVVAQTPSPSRVPSAPNSPAIDCTAYSAQNTSPYVVPWDIGQSYEVWRSTEHWNPGNRGVGLYAIDFRMPIGTRVTAAREGKVVAVQESYVDGNGEDLKENLVFIKHADGTVARYFHLTHQGVLVNMGDEVKQGQVIALSGNTGDSAGPHLHFDVQSCGPNLNPNYNRYPCGQTLPVTFRNAEPSACGLVPGKSYQALEFTPNTPASLREADTAAITKTALDYIEGWYSGDAARMQRALHPDLAKRRVETNQMGAGKLDHMAALTLIDATRAGAGRTPKEQWQKDVTVLDLFENAATARIVASDWIDYLHLTRFNGRWQIVNVLWELKPEAKHRR